jgi:hypothetical protein
VRLAVPSILASTPRRLPRRNTISPASIDARQRSRSANLTTLPAAALVTMARIGVE